MNTPLNQTTPSAPRAGMHPMLIAAAIAIVVFCLAGTAAIMGWLPGSIGRSTSSDLTATDRAALASRLADGSTPDYANGLAPARDSERLALLERDRLAADRERELADLERERERDRALAAERERAPAREVREPVRLAKAEPVRQVCNSCGRVVSVDTIKQRAQGSGLGAAGGAVLGGLLGNQVGGGNGRKLATVAGAVGGAVVGNQVEGNMKATTTYRVHVRLDSGKERSFDLQNLNGYSAGDRIRIVNGGLRHAN